MEIFPQTSQQFTNGQLVSKKPRGVDFDEGFGKSLTSVCEPKIDTARNLIEGNRRLTTKTIEKTFNNSVQSAQFYLKNEI